MDCYGGFDLHIWEAQLGGGATRQRVDWKDGSDGWIQWRQLDKVGWKQTEVTGHTASTALDDIERYLLDY